MTISIKNWGFDKFYACGKKTERQNNAAPLMSMVLLYYLYNYASICKIRNNTCTRLVVFLFVQFLNICYNKNVGKRIDGGCFQHYPRGGVYMKELDKILTIIIIALLIELLRNIKNSRLLCQVDGFN